MATTDTNIVSPNLSQGRDRNVPATVDIDGNSLRTGKPPVKAVDIYQAQQLEDIGRHPAQAKTDYDTDPMWGLQDKQTIADVHHEQTRLPGGISPAVPLQPNFGWVPNPEDLTPPDAYKFERNPQSQHDAPAQDWAWNPQDEPDTRVPRQVRVPGGISPGVPLQPDFGWVPTY